VPGVHVPPELFVAYADEDREWVHGFLLAEVGLDRACVITPDDFRPGAVLVEELERAVTTARCTVMVLTPAFGASPLAALAELLASHDSLRRDSDRLVPLLLKPVDLPLHLDFRVRLDCTDPARWPAEAARLRELLQRGAPPPEELACPYPGLIAFGPEQAGLFFGRDRESDEICRLVRQHGFLLVVGPSGSGKSSLVSAGVLPRLRAADGDRWLVRTVRPSASVPPLASLLGESAAGGGRPLGDSVAALLATVPGAERLLLLVDQAEAIFVLPSREDRDRYLDLIGQLRRTEGCTVVLAQRADFFSDLMNSPLWPVSRGERVEITPLRGAALREAIVRPAAAVGAHIEPVLLERLLHDAGDEPDVLSLIQETMVLLWERRSRRLLTLSAYEDLGGDGRSGLAAALATRADAALADLLPTQQEIAQRILVRLVQLGEGRQDTRRQQPVDALRVYGEDPGLFDLTLGHLTNRRLVTIGSQDDGQPTADLGHEAMIAYWPTLRDWIAESRSTETARRRIERDAADWEQRGKDRGDLYRRHRLADALEVTATRENELTRTGARFLTAARRRRLAARLAFTMAIVLALTGVAWLAKTPIREAWLKYEAQAASPQAHVPGGTQEEPGGRSRIIPPLKADLHEVTNEQYRYCVEAQRCSAPNEPSYNARFAKGDLTHPVVFVTAYNAAEFCSWLGRRLPTVAEWRWIAYGSSGRKYPWGSSLRRPYPVNAANGRPPSKGLVAADSHDYLAGDSKNRLEQLLGNAAEWTATLLDVPPKGKVRLVGHWNGLTRVPMLAIMGGGWREGVQDSSAAPNPSDPTATYDETGFRCIQTE
jgi:formylglycine-generating enzyme required for sulfatase activity